MYSCGVVVTILLHSGIQKFTVFATVTKSVLGVAWYSEKKEQGAPRNVAGPLLAGERVIADHERLKLLYT